MAATAKKRGKNTATSIAGSILAVTIAAAVTAPLWVVQSPTQIQSAARLLSPTWTHPFGTDHFGRDIFARVVYGAQISLGVGFLVTLFSVVLGTATGLVAGYYRKADSFIMRIIDGMMAFPSILLAIAMVAALGGNLFNLVVALVIAFWPIMTRIVRSSTLLIANMQYVEAAKAIGTKPSAIMARHILPNALTPIIVQATFIFAEAILAEAALSFLGLGIKPPTPSWGSMLGESRIYLTTAPWFSILPGIVLMLVVLSLNIFGNKLRDLAGPHSAGFRKRLRPKFARAVRTEPISDNRKGG
ncbi:ABC transporter permease [Cohnella algarum]|uniref:ABC transporter permease n=1 Tax=Cohnella algarum TaxID=2044859 RepID=UPI0019673E8C|nr:ABC transporter permease [Cohnella algarum]MBN2984420.1 ABC transporter permease [Cohnella algarum]